MNELNLKQPTDFRINSLNLLHKGGSTSLTRMFEEINIYESMLTPCISGNILITDAIGLCSKLLLDGTEILEVDIDKGEGLFRMKRAFKVYKLTDRKNVNQTSESYVLRFVSDEMILSEQQTIGRAVKGTYTDIVGKILKNDLRVSSQNLNGIYDDSYGITNFVMPNLKPFDAIVYCSKKAIDSRNQPSFMFFENVEGYNFCTLSTIMQRPAMFDVNFNVKNLPGSGSNLKNEIIGARAMEVVTQFDFLKNTQAGVYSGSSVGIDLMCRRVIIDEKTLDSQYNNLMHLNPNPNAPVVTNALGKDNFSMPKSRISYNFTTEGRHNIQYIKDKEPGTLQTQDVPQKYAYSRKAILQNFVGQRVKVVLPGNFLVSPGRTVNLLVPSRSVNTRDGNNYDTSLKGKYAILSTRHIIRYNMFETVAEMVTDSSQKPVVKANEQQANKSRNY